MNRTTVRTTPAQRAREAAGWEIVNAARWLGVTEKRYEEWEQRGHFPFRTARMLAAAYDVEVSLFRRDVVEEHER